MLTGREGELTMLAELVGELARGNGSSLLLEGEPGIGKSSLVRAALGDADNLGLRVTWGAGDELGQSLPLVPFLDALRVRSHPDRGSRRDAIVRLLDGAGTADREADVPAVLAEQLLALIAEECAAQPMVLVIDDLQWADIASVRLWGRLARSARQMPLLLVGMMRPAPPRDDLVTLRRMVAGDAVRLRLAGLTDEAVADLVAALAGGEPDDGLLRLAAAAGGNPLYLTELVAAAERSSMITLTGAGTATLVPGPVPGSLPAVIAERLDVLSGPSRDVLRAAAVLGVDFAVTDLSAVTGRGAVELLQPIDEAREAGVLAESGDGLGFRHPLIRQALYEEIPAPERGARHLAAGRALAAVGASAPRVARQLLQAVSPQPDGSGPVQGQPVDEWMLSWLGGAADALVSLAPGVAAELLGKAADSGLPEVTGEAARRGWLVSRLADALYRVGDRKRAEELAARTLAEATDPDLRIDLHWTLTQCRMLAGQAVESLAALDRALAEPGLPARHRARLMVLAARTYLVFGETETAYQVGTDALAAARQAGDTWATSWALHVLAMAPSVHGQPADALPLYDQALALTQADPALSDLRLLMQINKGIVLSTLDRHEEAFAALRPALRLADQAGTAMRRSQAHSALGQALFTMGRWDDALAEIGTLPADLKEPAVACCELAISATVSFHRGETAVARRQVASAAEYARRVGHRVIPEFALARSMDREAAGAPSEALTVLTDAVARGDGLGETEDLIADAVRLAMATGNLDTARSLADRADIGAESEIPHRRANALYCQGLLSGEPGRLLESARLYEDAGRPLMRAKALEAAAAALSQAGESGSALARAVEVYTSLGAAADVNRLKAGPPGAGSPGTGSPAVESPAVGSSAVGSSAVGSSAVEP